MAERTYPASGPQQDHRQWGRSGFVGRGTLFDGHVLEFTGLKDITAFEALDKLGVLFAGDNLHPWMPTLWLHADTRIEGWWTSLNRAHNFRASLEGPKVPSPEIGGYFSPTLEDVNSLKSVLCRGPKALFPDLVFCRGLASVAGGETWARVPLRCLGSKRHGVYAHIAGL